MEVSDVRPAVVFARDLAVSARALRRAPLLLGLTLALLVPYYGPYVIAYLTDTEGYVWLSLPASLIFVGWVGTERLWFRRLYYGSDLARSELGPVTRRMFGRYMRLGLIVTVPYVGAYEALQSGGTWGIVGAAVLLVAYDALLTFTAPALTYSTRSASRALRIGWGMLRSTWPHCAWHVLTPPLALLALVRFLPRDTVPLAARYALLVLGEVLLVWFKGAIAAYYLRINVTGPNGAL